MAKRWYIIHVYSGFEKKVRDALEEQARQKGLSHLFEQILVPMEEVVEVRRGKKVPTERKFFPGYVLVKMELNDETWSLVRNTAKVTGFLGPGGKPMPIPDAEAERIINQVSEVKEHPRPTVTFVPGDQVRWPRGRSPPSRARSRRWTRPRAGSRCWFRSSAGRLRSNSNIRRWSGPESAR